MNKLVNYLLDLHELTCCLNLSVVYGRQKKKHFSCDEIFTSFPLAQRPPRDLQVTAYSMTMLLRITIWRNLTATVLVHSFDTRDFITDN